jgi:MoaA/NifB/PqqE/SkfB family radical SAM enzyme
LTITTRIDAITGIGDAWRQPICPAPRSVKVELTANCNYRCTFCVKSLRPDDGEMDRKLYSRIIREMRDAGVEELGVFYIGESFTCKWLHEAIAEAKEVGFPYVFCTTNAAAATPGKVQRCFDAGLDSLKFSLNFTDGAQLADIAQVSGRNFEKAIQHIKQAKAIRDEGAYGCRLYASSIAFDGEQGEKMRRVVSEILPFVDQHYWLPLYGMSGAAKEHGWTPKPGNPGRLDNMREPLPCWSVFSEGHVTKDGLLAACCFGSGIDGDQIMGDLKTQPFMEAWNSEKYQALRVAHLARDVSSTACRDCAAA